MSRINGRASVRRAAALRDVVDRREKSARVAARAPTEPRSPSGDETADLGHVADLQRTMLAVAVPMWIERLRLLPSFADVQRIAHESGLAIAEKGDVLQFGGKGCKDAFNAVARGLACGAFAPGGVRYLGEHWEAKQPADWANATACVSESP